MRTVWRKAEQIGSMNRVIYLELPLHSKDDFGGQERFFVRSPAIWAAYKSDTASNENQDADRLVAQKRITFRVHYLSILAEDMGVLYNDQWYDIVAIYEDELQQFATIEVQRREEVYDWKAPASGTTLATDSYGNSWALNGAGSRSGLFWVDQSNTVWEKQ